MEKVKERKNKKIVVDSEEIKFFIVSKDTGKIKSSGDVQEDTWEDTFVDLSSVVIGKPLRLSFNKDVFERKYPNREAVFTHLNFNTLKVTEE